MTEAQRNIVLKRLEDAKLLTVNREKSGALVSLDAHPLLREYFALGLRKNTAAWEAAHKRLFEHLCVTEALEPMRGALERAVELENWNNAAIGASTLSDLELTLGDAGLDPTVVSPGAIWVNRSAAGLPCRVRSGRKGSHAPRSAGSGRANPWA
jgi:hypothetical protein